MTKAKERILVRSVNWLGDAVMTTPALLRLREARPSAHIVLLTPAKLSGLWEGQPMLDAVLTFENDDGPFRIARRLKSHSFDTALVFPNSPRSALECFLAGIPRRIGYARPWRNFLLTEAIPSRPDEIRMHKRTKAEIRSLISGKRPQPERTPAPTRTHHLYHYLELAAVLGARSEVLGPKIFVSPNSVTDIRKRFGLATLAPLRPLIGINPGAEYGPAKRWLADRFTEAAVQLQQVLGCDIWIFGGMGDRDLASSIAQALIGRGGGNVGSVRSLAGQTSLQELCAGLKACDVVLTNDTGPMHVAAAVGTPVVVPFGSTSPVLTGPGLPGDSRHAFLAADVPCSPCFLRKCPIDFRCMEKISVASVVTAVVHSLRSCQHQNFGP